MAWEGDPRGIPSRDVGPSGKGQPTLQRRGQRRVLPMRACPFPEASRVIRGFCPATNAPNHIYRRKQASRGVAGPGWTGQAVAFYWHVLLWGCRAWSGDGLEPGPSVSSRCRRTCSAGGEMVREGPLPAVEGLANCVPWASHLGTMGYIPSLRCVNYAHSPSWPLMQVRMTVEALCHSNQGWLEFEGGR